MELSEHESFKLYYTENGGSLILYRSCDRLLALILHEVRGYWNSAL